MSSLPISSTPRKKRFIIPLLTVMTLSAAVLSIFVGSVELSAAEVISALISGEADSSAARIVLFSRLPRTLAALLAGAALAVSGAVVQTVLLNPMAAPSVIGVNSGAGLAVAAVCAVSPLSQQWTPIVAFLGAFVAASLVLFLAERTGASRTTVILAGIAVSQLFSAGTDAIITLVPDALVGVSDFRIGGFSGVTGVRLVPAAALIVISLAAVLSLSPQLDILSLGGDTAQSLGLNVRAVRFVLLALSAALAGAAVSFSGLIGFVGLIVPHAARRFVGGDSLPLTVCSALGGAMLVTVCDVLSRVLFAPYELPVGIILAFAGAPFFLFLLLRRKGGRV